MTLNIFSAANLSNIQLIKIFHHKMLKMKNGVITNMRAPIYRTFTTHHMNCSKDFICINSAVKNVKLQDYYDNFLSVSKLKIHTKSKAGKATNV